MSIKPIDSEQVPTQPTTIKEIMARPTFERGVADVRSHRGYPSDYDEWTDTDDCWDYERGRLWARLVPHHIKLKLDGEVTAQAVRLYEQHADDIP